MNKKLKFRKNINNQEKRDLFFQKHKQLNPLPWLWKTWTS